MILIIEEKTPEEYQEKMVEIFQEVKRVLKPEGGLVLDPFMGAGTTGLMARKLKRKYLGIELNPVYLAMAEKRIKKTQEILLI